mmetsp:Transcript_5182/g.12883  ORF Transcript_5182/g.12883 Transcript_5182/m.12883 type:complete len:247 (-) Transcript_5182:3555-4295(-)
MDNPKSNMCKVGGKAPSNRTRPTSVTAVHRFRWRLKRRNFGGKAFANAFSPLSVTDVSTASKCSTSTSKLSDSTRASAEKHLSPICELSPISSWSHSNSCGNPASNTVTARVVKCCAYGRAREKFVRLGGSRTASASRPGSVTATRAPSCKCRRCSFCGRHEKKEHKAASERKTFLLPPASIPMVKVKDPQPACGTTFSNPFSLSSVIIRPPRLHSMSRGALSTWKDPRAIASQTSNSPSAVTSIC